MQLWARLETVKAVTLVIVAGYLNRYLIFLNRNVEWWHFGESNNLWEFSLAKLNEMFKSNIVGKEQKCFLKPFFIFIFFIL